MTFDPVKTGTRKEFLADFLLVLEPPEGLKKQILERHRKVVAAREELAGFVKSALPETLREKAILVGPDRVVLEEPVADPKILAGTPFRLKTDPKVLYINRRTKIGRNFAGKLEELHGKGALSPLSYLIRYAGRRFGFLHFFVDEDSDLVLFVGLYGVDEKKMEKDGWRRWLVWLAPPAK